MSPFRTWLLMVFVATALGVVEGQSSGAVGRCVVCSGSINERCGQLNGIDSARDLSQVCDAGYCSTVIRATFNDMRVDRVCGGARCSNLPAYYPNRASYCDPATDTVRPVSAGQLFNQTRIFNSSQPNQENGLMVTINSCNVNDDCNAGAIGVANVAQGSASSSSSSVVSSGGFLSGGFRNNAVVQYCVVCNGNLNDACGRLSNANSANDRSRVICPYGFCSTLIRTQYNGANQISRGCGAVRCSDLPAQFSDNSDVCDQSSQSVRPLPAGQLFNQTRAFTSTRTAAENGLSVTLNYCNSDNYCNAGPVVFQRTSSAIVNQADRCISCSSHINEACGGYSNGGSVISGNTGSETPSVPCADKYCYTLVRTSPGEVARVERGCGGVLCTNVPGGNLGEYCDANGRFRTISQSSSLPFNQTRQFGTPYNQPGSTASYATLQYCNTNSDCNAGVVLEMPKDFYAFTGSASASNFATALFSLLLPLLTALYI